MKINKLYSFSLFSLLLLFSSVSLFAQETILKGVVTSENGDPVPYVNLVIKGTTKGTMSSFDGSYQLSGLTINDIIAVSSVGYISQEIKYVGQKELNITVKEDAEQLDEIVVIGYGTQKKSDLTGSTGVVTAEDSDLQPVPNVQGMLQGKMAGVVVSQNSGAPGAAPKVNVRGFTGNPIYVIDGLIDGDINAVNPNDIENISVLKDASATAIYGSRGANGVIIVTTKGGKKNSPLKVNGEYYHTISQLNNKLDLLDPVSYMKIVNKKKLEAGANEIFSRDEIRRAESTPGFGTDWQDEIYRTAHSDNANISLSKGWENTTLRFSLGARNDQGIIRNTNYERYTSRLSVSSSLTSTMELNFNGSFTQEKGLNMGQGGQTGSDNAVASATAWAPNLPVFDESTGDYTGFQGYGATVRRNPVYLTDEILRNSDRKTYATNLSLTQKILPELKFKVFGAVQYRGVDNDTYTRYEPATANSVSKLYQETISNVKYQGNAQLDFNKEFNSNHKLNATAVFEVISRQNKRDYFTTSFDQGEDQEGTLSERIYIMEPEGMLSALGRVGYSYKDKLLFTGSIRLDGSSRLPKDNQWDDFYSAALAYKLSNEEFLKNSDVISNLKLRIGYGEIGNVNSLNAFQVQDLTNPLIRPYVFNGTELSYAEGIENGNNRANPELRWEVSRQTNFGIDLGLFDDKIQVNADYYNKITDDSHFNSLVPAYLGGGTVKSNTGTIKNEGIELQLTYKYTSEGKFSMRNTLSFNYNDSEVINIPQDTVYVGTQENGFDRQSHILIQGQQVGQLYGYKYLGVKTSNTPIDGEIGNLKMGDAIYLDANGDGKIDVNDMQVLGNGHPDFTWGFNSFIDYGNWSLNIFIQGVHGVDVFNLPQHGLLGGGSGVLDATSTEIYNSYSFDRNGTLPSLNARLRTQSSMFVEDASFIRIKNITLAYQVPLKAYSLRVYGGAQNVYTFTNYKGYDPEANSGSNLAPGVDRGSFPLPITYTFGLNFGF
ncbi:SusC/RagA family TonB-linked outer membrane protein [Flammeovirga aprica]|uniref:TonB-dependent receptor n=1 Tax=Flammeovirga aprica JL-4 TaxID=694437 RepID=A0A7X9RXX2_9BACT|nr:TonB-dependent receptor [Flammeovirga aprica]NME70771.1 TonB-dependent receptor [Flammeovirga aprica JL-4]